VSRAIVATCAIASAFAVSCSGLPGRTPDTGGPREHAVVQFTESAVAPETVRITPDGNVNWVSTAAEYTGFVVFPASVASSFTCDDLRPDFSKIPEGYRSLPLTDYASERVELPCPLVPGSYDYEIWLIGAGLGQAYDGYRPERKLRGQIVVVAE
jgi:hypothetical protein